MSAFTNSFEKYTAKVIHGSKAKFQYHYHHLLMQHHHCRMNIRKGVTNLKKTFLIHILTNKYSLHVSMFAHMSVYKCACLHSQINCVELAYLSVLSLFM